MIVSYAAASVAELVSPEGLGIPSTASLKFSAIFLVRALSWMEEEALERENMVAKVSAWTLR